MRVQLIGDNDTINGLKGLLHKGKFQLVNIFPTHIVEVKELELTKAQDGRTLVIPEIIVDSVESELEVYIINNITELSVRGRILLQRAEGNQDDKKVVISVPKEEKEIYAVQVGILRSLMMCRPEKKWYQR